MTLIADKSWLNPILPETLPASILEKADTLPAKAAFLAGRLAPETAARLSKLLLITNTYYSNLIEGQYTEPAAMQIAQNAPKRERQLLKDQAVKHMEVQRLFERALSRYPRQFQDMFSTKLISTVHFRLFHGTDEDSRRLSDGRVLVPGALRSTPDEEVFVGNHAAPAATAVSAMLAHLQAGFGASKDPRRRLIAVLAYHHRLAWVHPFLDGNGRVARMITHLQLVQLGLEPYLWSLSRGLARRHEDYYRALAMADRQREGDLDGRGQMSQKHYFAFIEFMLDVCHDQVDYMISALDRTKLRERVLRAFKTNERLLDAGIRPESAPAVIALLMQGALPRNEFKTFTGLPPRSATDELTRLIKTGIVVSPTPKSRTLEPGLPAWFAQDIFPDLHRRFQ
ncbi:TPA: Fic family protein [Pseudomonas aeruginosa]|uniref:Cell filamentation protein Fic n=1 Tax=Pseudomonas aeruginosa TaxID=287 RepID=A0A241XRN8_PSEAI|nr:MULTISPECIES: Fic family protein [Pseudomonas]ELG7182201.1 Fic family protein [Pseudomonas aeruginosa]MBH4095059.1 Fic family protein [Pseudomonas aeruginosa]MBI6599326.1 Fic family protein [Pseudomonas sp. S4_EA_1b]MBI8852419.1 Fic family protein [Pseudomonas aeruginosa]OTI63163.1 cell filamentation protein Fic [Pseudomonas aeruginosa]